MLVAARQRVGRADRRAQARTDVVQHRRLRALGLRRCIPVFVLGPAPGIGDHHDGGAVGSAAFVAVNFAFISLAISFHQRMPVLPLLKEEIRLVGPAFAIQAFLARSPLRSGDGSAPPRPHGRPLFTVTLYQRSSLASTPTRDAHTDSLTLVGNNRAYELGLSMALDAAYEDGTPLSLCLVDVDDFKQINDTYGHPLGDQVLVEIAASCSRRATASEPSASAGTSSRSSSAAASAERERTSRRCTSGCRARSSPTARKPQ